MKKIYVLVLLVVSMLCLSQWSFGQENVTTKELKKTAFKEIQPKALELKKTEPKPLEVMPLELKAATPIPGSNQPELKTHYFVLDTLRSEPLNKPQHYSLTRDKDSVIIRKIDRKN